MKTRPRSRRLMAVKAKVHHAIREALKSGPLAIGPIADKVGTVAYERANGETGLRMMVRLELDWLKKQGVVAKEEMLWRLAQ